MLKKAAISLDTALLLVWSIILLLNFLDDPETDNTGIQARPTTTTPSQLRSPDFTLQPRRRLLGRPADWSRRRRTRAAS